MFSSFFIPTPTDGREVGPVRPPGLLRGRPGRGLRVRPADEQADARRDARGGDGPAARERALRLPGLRERLRGRSGPGDAELRKQDRGPLEQGPERGPAAGDGGGVDAEPERALGVVSGPEVEGLLGLVGDPTPEVQGRGIRPIDLSTPPVRADGGVEVCAERGAREARLGVGLPGSGAAGAPVLPPVSGVALRRASGARPDQREGVRAPRGSAARQRRLRGASAGLQGGERVRAPGGEADGPGREVGDDLGGLQLRRGRGRSCLRVHVSVFIRARGRARGAE